VARIALLGGECTGKSTLAAALAHSWAPSHRVIGVDEELRTFIGLTGRTPRADEQESIQRAQQDREDAAVAAAGPTGIVIVDPAPLMTAVYSIQYFNDPSLLPDALERAASYDLIVWCAPDLPWQEEAGVRDGADYRDRSDQLLSDEVVPALRSTGANVVRVTGSVEERVAVVGQAWQPIPPEART
jgi:nicotinamide riboside kinase